MLKFFASVLALVLSVSAVAAPKPSVQALRYKQLGREAASRKFLAKLGVGYAEGGRDIAQQTYDRAVKLVPGGAVSQSELSNAIMKLAEKQFEVKRQQYLFLEAQTVEKTWKLQAEWAAGAPEDAHALAEEYLTLRQRRLRLLEDFLKDAEPYVAEMKKEAGRVRKLRGNGISEQEYEHIVALEKGIVDLLAEAVKEKGEAITHLVEAEEDEVATRREVAPLPRQKK